jgi:hypothetical protein
MNVYVLLAALCFTLILLYETVEYFSPTAFTPDWWPVLLIAGSAIFES